jgi:dTDP-4-dehydrorhamnose reductase
MKKILLLGGVSFSGYRFYNLYKHEYEIICTHNDEIGFENSANYYKLDILKFDQVKNLIELIQPDIIINTISIANVDECEKNKTITKKINYEFIVQLVDYLLGYDDRIYLIHFSSNAVYDGQEPLYSELTPSNPKNYYGLTKMKADIYIENKYNNYLIARPITMIGENETFQRGNPFTFIYNKLKANVEIKLVNDVFVNFLYVNDLCWCINKLISQDIKGIFNISGDEILSWHSFGLKIAKELDLNCDLINSCSINDFPTLATRPRNTSFDNRKIKSAIRFKATNINKVIRSILK